jgi:hypothetical protein
MAVLDVEQDGCRGADRRGQRGLRHQAVVRIMAMRLPMVLFRSLVIAVSRLRQRPPARIAPGARRAVGRSMRYADSAAMAWTVTAADYATTLEVNLLDLLNRIKSGRYKAPPVCRTYIPKTDGSRRLLGIPTFEDKLAQRAIVMVLEAVYEQDFLSCSFGFRPGRLPS